MRARVSTAVCSVLVVVVASAASPACSVLSASAASELLTATACVLGGPCWLAARRRLERAGVRAMACAEGPSSPGCGVKAVPRRAVGCRAGVKLRSVLAAWQLLLLSGVSAMSVALYSFQFELALILGARVS